MCFPETDTSDAILARIAVVAGNEIGVRLLAGVATDESVAFDGEGLVAVLGRCAGEIAIQAVLEPLAGRDVRTVLAALQVVSFDDVLAVVEVVARHLLTLEAVVTFHDLLSNEFL